MRDRIDRERKIEAKAVHGMRIPRATERVEGWRSELEKLTRVLTNAHGVRLGGGRVNEIAKAREEVTQKGLDALEWILSNPEKSEEHEMARLTLERLGREGKF